ncbi:MAG: NADH-quinone oxidoreductase subunit J, partial [Eubacterium sp.]|nr:NADH-quinone oxidoreductase subunit J [Eubacterium sp.]
MDIGELSKIMQESGIVGAGGAGFPSYAKLNGKTETLILNCAECEPLLKLHRQLLERYAAEIAATFYR